MPEGFLLWDYEAEYETVVRLSGIRWQEVTGLSEGERGMGKLLSFF